MIDHKLGEAKLNLSPPELGSLEIKISFVEDKAHVHMVAQQGQARDALEQGLPRLRELLTQGGMDLGGASVSGGREQRHDTDARPPATPDAVPFPEPEAGSIAPAASSSSGRVDLYA
jgi:flagellar hook-length control protein FliK